MNSLRTRGHTREKSEKSKKDRKLSKLINNSDSDTGNESEHELSYYMGDRVKLMKEVLKIIKPKKIKIMAPDCMKRLQSEEINSILLEELLGISSKRLNYIFEGKNLDEESSTDEDQPIDVISLDDISDDDFVIISDDETDKTSKKKKRRKIKEEPKERSKKIKKEKPDKERGKEKTKDKDKGKDKEKTTSKGKGPIGEENLMSVLELLELQARARAIRSQLDLETKRKKEEQDRLEREAAEKAKETGQEDDEEIIMEIPKEVEIVITSSDSESEDGKKGEKDKARDKVSTSKQNAPTNNTNSMTSANNTNESRIQINDDSSQDNDNLINKETIVSVNKNLTGKENAKENQANENRNDSNSNDKEEGEVSDNETHQNGGNPDLLTIPVPPDSGTQSVPGAGSSNSSGSDSDSSDNLQVIMQRETRRKKRRVCVKSVSSSKMENTGTENMESIDHINDTASAKNSNETKLVCEENNKKDTSNQQIGENGLSEEKTSLTENESDSGQSGSKIETAIEEFLRTQPPPPSDNSKELKKAEEETKEEEKAKRVKQKRIKNLKNKLQSYKKDVEGESSVTILENIVIKPQAVDNGKSSRNKVAEDNDDLVINVDQDDLDCIICD